MICEKCGAVIQEGMKFCSSCGTPVTVKTVPVQPPAMGTAPKYCGSCGALIEGNNKFCGSCGTPVAVSAAPIKPASFPAQPAAPASAISDKKLPNYKLIGIVASAAAAIIVLIGLFSLLSGGNNPEAILKKYMKASINMDYKTAAKYSAYDVDSLIKEMYTAEGLTEKEFQDRLYERMEVGSMDELYKEQMKKIGAELRSKFGSNYKVTLKISGSTTVKRSEMNNRIESLQKTFDRRDYDAAKIIRLDKITEMIDFELESAIKGSKDEDSSFANMTMVKIGGKWRVLDEINQYLRF